METANLRRLERRTNMLGWSLCLPAGIGVLATLLLPALVIVPLAFTNWTFGQTALQWVGLANFKEFFYDSSSNHALRNTVLYVAMTVPASVLLGLAVAIGIESLPFGKKTMRAIYFLPVVSTFVAMAAVWQLLLHPSLGMVNDVLRMLGVQGPDWLRDPVLVLPVLAFVGVWETIGFNMVLFLAGLKSIPRDYYEAGEIDGVDTAWERFATITWPLLGPTTLFVVVITAIRSFRVFESVAVLTKGGPAGASEVLLYSIYNEGFGLLRIGYASAITLIFLLALMILTLVQVFVADRRIHY